MIRTRGSFVAEVNIKVPYQTTVHFPRETTLTLSATGSTQEEAENNLKEIARSLSESLR